MNSKTRLAALATMVTACGLAAAVVPSAAIAMSAPIHITSTVNMRPGTSTSSGNPVGSIPTGASLDFVCWAQGQNVGGVDVWFRVNYGGRTGYYASYYDDSSYSTDSQITSKYGIPNCSYQPPATSTPAPSQPAPSSGTYVSRNDIFRFCVDMTNRGCSTPQVAPQIAANTRVSMVCWQDGSNYTGDYTTNRWFWVNASTGSVGFLSASIVRDQTAVPACSTNPAVVAASTAAARDYQTTASAADRALFNDSEWAPGPPGEWAGDCPKLPYIGWHAAGITIQKGNAIDNYNYYNARGMVHPGAPPLGAVVFYRWSSLGHTAISIGDNLIASTTGTDNQGTPNTIESYAAPSNYLGWMLPA